VIRARRLRDELSPPEPMFGLVPVDRPYESEGVNPAAVDVADAPVEDVWNCDS
jgi:hypothetical protein